MTTICCVKCPDCKCNPAPRGPARSHSLIGLLLGLCQVHLLLPAAWGRGGGKARTTPGFSRVPKSRGCHPPVPPPRNQKSVFSLLSHRNLCWVSKGSSTTDTAHGSPGTSDHHLTANRSSSSPQRHHSCPLLLLGGSGVSSSGPLARFGVTWFQAPEIPVLGRCGVLN